MFLLQIQASKNSFRPWDIKAALKMAETMKRMTAACEPTTPDNLKRYGYSSQEITTYGLRAARIARTNSVMAALA